MVDLYLAAFLVLLLLYGAYSEWSRLDSRYPIVAGLVLLAFTGLASAAGAYGTASTLAVYAFFLLVAGVLLLIVDEARGRWGRGSPRVGRTEPPAERRESSDQRNRPAQESLDGLEQ